MSGFCVWNVGWIYLTFPSSTLAVGSTVALGFVTMGLKILLIIFCFLGKVHSDK